MYNCNELKIVDKNKKIRSNKVKIRVEIKSQVNKTINNIPVWCTNVIKLNMIK